MTDIEISYVTVPITALVHPLCVIPDGAEKDSRRPNKTLRVLSLYDVVNDTIKCISLIQ